MCKKLENQRRDAEMDQLLSDLNTHLKRIQCNAIASRLCVKNLKTQFRPWNQRLQQTKSNSNQLCKYIYLDQHRENPLITHIASNSCKWKWASGANMLNIWWPTICFIYAPPTILCMLGMCQNFNEDSSRLKHVHLHASLGLKSTDHDHPRVHRGRERNQVLNF